ncbi:MAG TPA: MBL fold metallo-hydrolase, partial [Plasticicumulans sp.]|nr:MBL fold metallo-hydrolase [Plasticicumulans sp.]
MDFDHGISAIDTGFERPLFDASHLIIDHGRAAFVDAGVNASVPMLIGVLEHKGLTPAAVDWLLLTHVHLDHAGGAGELLRRLPNAKLVVHPRGVRHMVDPTALMAGASAVYGEDVVRRTYGTLTPVPPGRIVEATEGLELVLGSRRLT